MNIHFLRLTDEIIAILKIEAFYSAGEVEDVVIQHFRTLSRSHRKLRDPELFSEYCVQIVSSLHELFLSKGDHPAYHEKFRNNPFQWYMASCELLLLSLGKENNILICHIGETHVFQKKPEGLEQLISIHNVQTELKLGTIEMSCLAPFANRTNRQIAEQLMPDSPSKLIEQLANLERTDFEKRIGHVRSRVIGYFPDHQSTKVYRYSPPLPSLNEISISGDKKIYIYYPEVQELAPYNLSKIETRVHKLLQQTAANPNTASDILDDRGKLLVVNIGDKNKFGECYSIS